MNGRKIFQATTITVQFHAFRNTKGVYLRKLVKGDDRYVIRRITNSDAERVRALPHNDRLAWCETMFADRSAHYSNLALGQEVTV